MSNRKHHTCRADGVQGVGGRCNAGKPVSFYFKPSTYSGPRAHILRPKDVATGKPKFRHLLKRKNFEVYSAVANLGDDDVREAVLRSLPRVSSRSVPCLYRFAVECRRLAPNGTADSWEDTLKTWFFLAQPVNPKLRWPWVQRKFEAFHRNTNATKPTARLDALATPAVDPKKPTADNCKAVLRALARRLGAVLYVSCRLMGEWLSVSPATAARVLNALVAGGFLRVVEKGQPSPFNRKATTYDLTPLVGPNPERRTPAPVAPRDRTPVNHRGTTGTDAKEEMAKAEVITSCVSPLEILYLSHPGKKPCPRCHLPVCDCFTPID